jgi:hypothetical protein
MPLPRDAFVDIARDLALRRRENALVRADVSIGSSDSVLSASKKYLIGTNPRAGEVEVGVSDN